MDQVKEVTRAIVGPKCPSDQGFHTSTSGNLLLEGSDAVVTNLWNHENGTVVYCKHCLSRWRYIDNSRVGWSEI